MKILISSLLIVSLTSFIYPETPLDPTNPDALFGAVEQGQKTLKKAQESLLKSIRQDRLESDSEFAIRKDNLLLEGNEETKKAEEALKQIVDIITHTTWRVDDDKIRLIVGPFETIRPQWNISVSSSDSAVPFIGSIVYDLTGHSDLFAEYQNFKAAIEANKVQGRLEYNIAYLGDSIFQIRRITVKIALTKEGLERKALASAPQKERWDFVLGNRQKPKKAKLIDMVFVPGGSFMMGGGEIEVPIHKVVFPVLE